ncbi:disulfide bond formation protein B [Legionella sp. km772]|uniref:disulfide bond formation protein B n=1 Tax=Legionella sp. km772 TaxID=2498111 RepID=UPI000F8DBBE4|nr:disulfide bond formation protein B [Legionella sp. km772]RUR12019.1 disulfide bond formation protein B [Legionella sp. km772]
MTKIQYRQIQYTLVLITAFVLFFSLYSQYVLGLQPCPLCLMQRICVFMLLGLMGLTLGTLKRARVLSLIECFFACAGLFFALRQLWLQSLPAGSAPACMPGLDILIRYFPWQDVARALLWGSGDCAESTWSFLGLSMAAWAACYFAFMASATLYLYFRTKSPD